jgi:hypothetical protein
MPSKVSKASRLTLFWQRCPPRSQSSSSSSFVLAWVVCLNGEGNRREVRLSQPNEKRPRTKDDDEEEDWELGG